MRPERESEASEREAMRTERDAMRTERDAMRTEREAMRAAEIEVMRPEIEAMRPEIVAMRAEMVAMRAELDTLRAERETERTKRETERTERETEGADPNPCATLAPNWQGQPARSSDTATGSSGNCSPELEVSASCGQKRIGIRSDLRTACVSRAAYWRRAAPRELISDRLPRSRLSCGHVPRTRKMSKSQERSS